MRFVIGQVLGQIQPAVQQRVKFGRGITQMHSHHAVLDLSTIAVVLPGDADRVASTFGRAGFINTTDGLGMSMLGGDQLLTAITQPLFIPLDGFEEPLQRARSPSSRQRDSLSSLAMNVGELTFDINTQQSPCVGASEAVIKQREKRYELPAQRPDLL